MADADTPPQQFDQFADQVASYLDEVKKLAEKRRDQDAKRATLIVSGAFKAAADPKHPVDAPAALPPTPFVEFAPLENAIAKLRASATAYNTAYVAHGATLSPEARIKLNGLLGNIDQLLLDDRGLPGRPWFKNLIYAPGRFTGYGAKTLPGVREAIEERRFDEANEYAVRTATAIEAYARRLDAARAMLEAK